MRLKTVHLIYIFILIQSTFSIIVSTTFGKVNGKEIGEFHSFKYVPFANPPIGNLRFQKPKTVDKWNDIRDATEYGPACMSNSSWTKSPQKWVDEDCLHVNIFTSNKCLKSSDCSVVVYFHGGDLHFDSAVMFDDNFIFDTFVKKDVVLVIPGFRLGIFSHFVVQDQSIAPNNLAFYDIIKSLEFVKSEIYNFGGDNKKVTILGHSYGGTITAMLTFSSRVNYDLSLFQRSISLSSHMAFEPLETHIEKTQRFANYSNCLISQRMAMKMSRSQQDMYTMKCLQKKSGMELLRIQRQIEDAGYPDYGRAILREPIFQNVKPSEFMNTPKKIPILTGCTDLEFDHEPELIPLPAAFGFDNYEECEEKYRRDLRSGKFDRGNHTDKTQAIVVPTKMRVDKLLEKGIPAYLYEYTYPKHGKHGNDLYYIMGIHPFEEDENEIHLQEIYRNMIINFVKDGNPGNGFEFSETKTSKYYELFWNETTGEKPKMKEGFEKKVTDYWLKEMMEYDRNITEMKQNKRNLQLREAPLIVDSFSDYQPSYLLSSFLLLLLVFFSGYFIGKCVIRDDRVVYMKLDGSNFENIKNF